MKARIKWIEDRTFLGESDSGHGLVVGGSKGADGQTLCPSPMEVVLIGMGACSAFDVVDILEKGREAVTDCISELSAERAEEHPRVFTRIHVHYVLSGRGLSRDKVARAIELTAEKYCSASIMISGTAEITYDFDIVESA